ncbi:MAG TPA: hypothetical protein VH476_05660, partial [Solirubrobacterales bacterium]
DPGGASKTNLIQSTAWDERSAASPDGKTVAYASHVNLNDVGIYLMNADGSNEHMLIDDPEVIETDPAFTPDGGAVLFSGEPTISNPDVYRVAVGGGTPVDLTNNGAIDRNPDACATNGKIAFVSSRTGDNDIYVMDANGANQTDLTEVSGSQEIEPSWSPDCSHIAYISSQNAGNYEVYVMEANGGSQTRITSTAAFEREPTWSPDGSLLAYASGPDVVTQAPSPGAATNPIDVGPVGAELAQPSWAPVPGSGPGGSGGGGGAGPLSGATHPETRIRAVHVHGRTAIVIFSASGGGVSFRCKLDKGRFRPCASPKKYRHLKLGRHAVQIEAIDRTGIADPTPAKRKFRIH